MLDDDVLRATYMSAEKGLPQPFTSGLREVEREATYWALFEASQFIYDELLGADIETRVKARALLRTEAAKHLRGSADADRG